MYQQNTTSQRTSHDTVSSIGFAIETVQGAVTTSVVGNMGAPLRTDEFPETGEDEEGVHFSKDPYNFGLIPESGMEEQNDVELLATEDDSTGQPRSLRED